MENSLCINNPGSYECECHTGLSKVADSCEGNINAYGRFSDQFIKILMSVCKMEFVQTTPFVIIQLEPMVASVLVVTKWIQTVYVQI